jgi:hypothetical protein
MACFLAQQTDEQHTQLGIPLGYAAPGAEDLSFAMLATVFDAGQQVVGSTYYLFADNGGIGELDPADGSAFVPLLQVIDAEGNTTWEPGSDAAFDATASYDFAREPLGAGVTVFMILSVMDYAGRIDAVLLSATL